MDQYRRQYDWCMPISSLPLSSTQATVCPCVHWRVGVSGWIIQMIVDVIKAPWAWLEALDPWRSGQSMGPSSGLGWHPRRCGLPARQCRARGGPRDPVVLVGTLAAQVLLCPGRYGSVALVEQCGRCGAQEVTVVMRREGPRRERDGPSVVRTGRDDRPRGARRGYCSPATSSVVPGGSIPSFYMIGSPGPQASHLEVRPVGPCRLEGKMVRAARERGPHGYG